MGPRKEKMAYLRCNVYFTSACMVFVLMLIVVDVFGTGDAARAAQRTGPTPLTLVHINGTTGWVGIGCCTACLRSDLRLGICMG